MAGSRGFVGLRRSSFLPPSKVELSCPNIAVLSFILHHCSIICRRSPASEDFVPQIPCLEFAQGLTGDFRSAAPPPCSTVAQTADPSLIHLPRTCGLLYGEMGLSLLCTECNVQSSNQWQMYQALHCRAVVACCKQLLKG